MCRPLLAKILVNIISDILTIRITRLEGLFVGVWCTLRSRWFLFEQARAMKLRRDWDRGIRNPPPQSTRGFRSFWVFDEADINRQLCRL